MAVAVRMNIYDLVIIAGSALSILGRTLDYRIEDIRK